MKEKEKDYLVICEAAKFCDKKFGTSICDFEKCRYILPHKRSHAPCTHCSHIVSNYKLKKGTRTIVIFGKGNMEIGKYIPGETKLAESLKELNLRRHIDDKYNRA